MKVVCDDNGALFATTFFVANNVITNELDCSSVYLGSKTTVKPTHTYCLRGTESQGLLVNIFFVVVCT